MADMKTIFENLSNPEGDFPESMAESLRKNGAVSHYVRLGVGDAGNHFTISDLRRLVAERANAGDDWEMPRHLSECGLCLDAFDSLLETTQAVDQRALERFERVVNEHVSGESGKRITILNSVFLRVAAVFVILCGLAWFFLARPAQPGIDAGMCWLSDGSELSAGASIPRHAVVGVSENTRLAFSDGSSVDFACDSRVKVDSRPGGAVSVELLDGSLSASVTPRVAWREFRVQTELGVIEVVGTEFNVTVEDQQLDVVEKLPGEQAERSYSDKVRTVSVGVEKGVVRVSNDFDSVDVGAGETAVMREGQRMILVGR